MNVPSVSRAPKTNQLPPMGNRNLIISQPISCLSISGHSEVKGQSITCFKSRSRSSWIFGECRGSILVMANGARARADGYNQFSILFVSSSFPPPGNGMQVADFMWMKVLIIECMIQLRFPILEKNLPLPDKNPVYCWYPVQCTVGIQFSVLLVSSSVYCWYPVQCTVGIQFSVLLVSSSVYCWYPVQCTVGIQFSVLLVSSSVYCWYPVQCTVGIQFSVLLASSSVYCWHPVQCTVGIQFSVLLASSSVYCWHPVQYTVGIQFSILLASSSVYCWYPVQCTVFIQFSILLVSSSVY